VCNLLEKGGVPAGDSAGIIFGEEKRGQGAGKGGLSTEGVHPTVWLDDTSRRPTISNADAVEGRRALRGIDRGRRSQEVTDDGAGETKWVKKLSPRWVYEPGSYGVQLLESGQSVCRRKRGGMGS